MGGAEGGARTARTARNNGRHLGGGGFNAPKASLVVDYRVTSLLLTYDGQFQRRLGKRVRGLRLGCIHFDYCFNSCAPPIPPR